MRAMRTVLVPLDGSALAESALPLALDVARRAAARVTLATVHTPARLVGRAQGVPTIDTRLDGERRAEVRAYLERVRHRVAREAPDLAGVDAAVLEGPVAETLAAYAAEADVDLVVLASHGRGGVRRAVLGSVADALVQRLDAPALLVRPGAGSTPASAPFRRVLVPIDGTPESVDGADAAVAVLGTLGVEYTALRVMSTVPRLFTEAVSTEGVEADATEQRETALDDLAAVERRLRDRGAAVRGVVRFHQSPAEGIVAYAAETGADLIALTTHGRGPIGRLLSGSVADAVLRAAAVPVLVQHAGTRRAAAPEGSPLGTREATSRAAEP